MMIVLLLILIIIIAASMSFPLMQSYLRSKFKKEHPGIFQEEYDYTDDSPGSILKSVFINYWIYGRKLIVIMHYRERFCVLDPKREYKRELIRTEYWTDESKKKIHLDGFKKVRGLHDSILWMGVPIYLRVENASYFIVPDSKTNGKFDYSQDTAETLHDYASSNATQKFIAAMSKTSMDNVDIQKIIMIALLAVGAIFGMKMLGVF